MQWSRKLVVLGSVFIVAATVAAYFPAFGAGFIWDDDFHLTRNPFVNSEEGLRSIWTSSYAMYYPLVLTTFWVQRHLWGLTPFPYHLFTVLIHAMNALLLWAVL